MSAPLARIAEAMNQLATLTPADQYQALVESEHTAELVRAMAPQDLHAIALAVGKEEAHELLPHCSGEQLVGLTDLSGWQGYRFDLVGFEDWLTAMFEAGHETIATYLKTADIEQLLLYMNHRFRVHEADEELDFAEDAYLRKVATGLGFADDAIAGLALDVSEVDEMDGILGDE